MPRASAIVLLILTLLVGLPPGSALITLGTGPGPVQGSWPSNPQLHCSWVFDSEGSAACNIYGTTGEVNQLHARVVGNARVTLAFVDDADQKVEVPLASIRDCRGDCIAALAGGINRGRFHLTVFAEGAAGSVVSVYLERAGPI